MPAQCHDRPCMHGGKCQEGWNRHICKCEHTSFSGAACGNGNSIKILFLITIEIRYLCNELLSFATMIILSFSIIAATTLKFQGNNSMSLKYDQSVEHEADDLIFRFRSVEQNGLLMSSRHDRSSDRLEVTLDAGRIKIFIHVSLLEQKS